MKCSLYLSSCLCVSIMCQVDLWDGSLDRDHIFHLDQCEWRNRLCCFLKHSEELNKQEDLTSMLCLRYTSSFSRVNPLALTQFPLRAGPSDTISISCNYKDHHPLLSQPHNHIHTQNTLPTGVIHAAWGVMGDYEWDRSMWWFTHKRSYTHTCATSSSMRASLPPLSYWGTSCS